MSTVILWEGNGSAAGPSAKFYVHRKVYYDTDESTATQLKVYCENSVYGPSTTLTAGSGKVSWSSKSFQIGGTSSTVKYNGTTYHISAKSTKSAYYNGGASYSMSSINAYYSGASGTTYKSTLSSGKITLPSLVPTYKVTYDANGGKNAPDPQYKQEGVDLILTDEEPTLTDKVFKSWTGSDGNTYKPGDTYTTDAVITMTAKWGTESTVHIKVDDAYKDGTLSVKVSDTYHEGIPYIKINGSYKEGI